VNIVSRYLDPEDVMFELDASGKARALEEIALLLERRHQVNHEAVLRALQRREEIGSTALGHGLAIPHARIAKISEPIVLLARTRLPINFGAPDHQPVSVLLVIIVPEHANEEHLQILATVSRMFSDPSFRERLEAARDSAAVRRLIDEWGSSD
jgi:PTS system nitrogen regulatory IIA component